MWRLSGREKHTFSQRGLRQLADRGVLRASSARPRATPTTPAPAPPSVHNGEFDRRLFLSAEAAEIYFARCDKGFIYERGLKPMRIQKSIILSAFMTGGISVSYRSSPTRSGSVSFIPTSQNLMPNTHGFGGIVLSMIQRRSIVSSTARLPARPPLPCHLSSLMVLGLEDKD